MEDFNCAVCDNIVKDVDCGHCFMCGWDADIVQENEPDYRGGANKNSLNEARAQWATRNGIPYTPKHQSAYAAAV